MGTAKNSFLVNNNRLTMSQKDEIEWDMILTGLSSWFSLSLSLFM